MLTFWESRFLMKLQRKHRWFKTVHQAGALKKGSHFFKAPFGMGKYHFTGLYCFLSVKFYSVGEFFQKQ